MTRHGGAVQQKVAALARSRGVPVQAQTVSFIGERFLHRLALAGLSGTLVLKGGHLFGVWDGDRRRATADVDLGHGGTLRDRELVSLLARAAATGMDDGVGFEPSAVAVEAKFSGVPRGTRAAIPARLGTSSIRLKVDVTFGQPVVPGPEVRWHQCPVAGLPPARLACAPKETMVAEKLAVMVEFGADNTRVRDYRDLWWLASTTAFDGCLMQEAVRRVFGFRMAWRSLSRDDGYWSGGLRPEFASRAHARSWDAFRSEQGAGRQLPDFGEAVGRVAAFALPLLHSVRDARRIGHWPCGGSRWTGCA